MKTTKWFAPGDKIPEGARYLYSEQRLVGWQESECWAFADSPIYETQSLYEISIPDYEVALDQNAI